ncbi:MAG: M3 family oligoendopeptidase, partial [Clostridia bacterium]|nr:M3 family oligoendopeptidase [Clostridia bacterium]MDD4543759.1 M3 family oligoendopeptidase [Clostridia bacterium]
SNALCVIPYIVCVDEFQHKVYSNNNNYSSKEIRHIWRDLEKQYMPWRDYDGNSFLEEGGFWMQKQHIFLYPFYYLEYSLAQICAFELYSNMKKNRSSAWEDYYRLCKSGGSKGYFELLEIANLNNPLKPETVRKAVNEVIEELMLYEKGQDIN